MAATEFEFVSLAEKAKQALDGINHALSSSLLLVDDPFALIIRHSYGLDAFYRTFQPLNVLHIDAELPTAIDAYSLQVDSDDTHAGKQHAAENGDGWDEWQWDEKTEAAAASSTSTATSSSASSNSVSSASPPVTVLLSGSLTPPVVSKLASVIASLRSAASFASSRLYVYSAVSSHSHVSAGLSSYSAIEALLPSPCSVHHLPLTYSLLLPSVFFIPSASSLSFTGAQHEAETASTDVLPSLSSLSSLVKGRPATAVPVAAAVGHNAKTANKQHGSTTSSSSSATSHSSSASSSVSSISAALSSLLIHLRLRPDVFSSGRVGHQVGETVTDAVTQHLQSISSASSSTNKGKAGSRLAGVAQQQQQQPQSWQVASVVLVDRMHDMAAVCSHTSHVLDHIYYTQRRTAEAVSHPISTSAFYTAVNALHHSGDKDCMMLLNALVNEPLPSALRIASRLVASASPEPSAGRRKGDVSVTKLREQVQQMEGNMGSLCAHHGLYQMTSALVRAEDDAAESDGDDAASSASDRWRQLQSLERVCLSSLPSGGSATSSDSPVATLVDLLQSPSTATASRSLPLLPLLSLSSFVFSVLGDMPLSASDEQQYRAALLRRVQLDRAHDELVARLVGGADDVEPFVERVMTLLQQMRYARATFSATQLSNLLALNSDEPRVEPFVGRLLSLCLDPSQSAADLEHHQQSAELSTFDQLKLGAKDTLKAAAALRGRGVDSANVQQSLSSFLSLGSSVVNKMTSSLSSSMAGGSTAAPSHPSQHSTLLFVVLGDVSWLEGSEMLRVAALHPACNVLIGCTGVADAEEMAWKTFAAPSAAAAAVPESTAAGG